jgi:3-hydroxyacyl-CoA dehydrogenase/enoyl-CoA hydratase/3-hydroxybutyryl-CoA epimerase
MPLVEVVKTNGTDSPTLATAVAVAGKLGKTPVITADAPGFLVNRVLFPYLAEALRMCSEGIPVFAIDEAIESWGMPMGPFRLMDEIGLDVTAMILKAMSPKLGERLACPEALSSAVTSGLLGRKSGKGFYMHSRERGVEPQVNHELAQSFSRGPIGSNTPSHEHVQLRLMLQMVNEAAMSLQEQVVESADSIDLATVTGLGFAPFRGGLARYCDFLGTSEVVTLLRNLEKQHGPQFKPCRLLEELARRGLPLAEHAKVAG